MERRYERDNPHRGPSAEPLYRVGYAPRAAAEALAAWGVPVIPLHLKQIAEDGDGESVLMCTCGMPHPEPHRLVDRNPTDNANFIRHWWSTWPGANIGSKKRDGTIAVYPVDPCHVLRHNRHQPPPIDW